MTKKKLSGQTVTIIVLAILLLLTCVFGGVYAYYSTTSAKISGIVKMANLKIEMQAGGSGSSGSSEILNTNSYYIPGQVLPNTALTVTNSSNTNVYMAVVYTVKAINNDESSPDYQQEITDYDLSNPLIGIHGDTTWFDGRFTNETYDADFRYLMISTPIPPAQTTIEVIPEGKLKLHEKMGNAYQSTIITLTFRAYVIGSEQTELNEQINHTTTTAEKCNVIMGAIFEAFDYHMV